MPDSIASSNEEPPRADLRELVRGAVEEMLDGLLDGEAMMEMRLAGASTRRIEDASGIPRGSPASAAAASNPNGRAFGAAEARGSRPLERARPCVYVDGIHLERSRGGSCENAAAMVATGVDGDGCREAMGAAEGFAESSERWRELLSRPRPRGLRGVRMFAGDEAAGMAGPIAEAFPEAARRRRTARFCRNVLARAPKTRRPRAAAMLKAAHAMESREAAEAKALEVASGLGKPRLGEAATVVGDGCAETLTYARSPREHWRRIRADDAIGRLNREIRRRARVAGAFPGGRSALMLATARLKHVAESSWGSRRYLDATLLDEQPYRKAGRLGCRKVRKNLGGTRDHSGETERQRIAPTRPKALNIALAKYTRPTRISSHAGIDEWHAIRTPHNQPRKSKP